MAAGDRRRIFYSDLPSFLSPNREQNVILQSPSPISSPGKEAKLRLPEVISYGANTIAWVISRYESSLRFTEVLFVMCPISVQHEFEVT